MPKKEFMIYDNPNDIVDKFFKSPFSWYQNNLEISMRGKDFTFDSVQRLYYKCHRINWRCGGRCIDSPGWIEKKKSTINPKKKIINFSNTR